MQNPILEEGRNRNLVLFPLPQNAVCLHGIDELGETSFVSWTVYSCS